MGGGSLLTGPLSSHQVLHVVHLFPQQMELPRQTLNFRFRTPIHGVIQFAPHAVFPVLPVLTHHDHRRLDRSKQRQNQIQQNKGIRIPRCPAHANVDCRVDAAQDEKTNNKGPRPAELHHGIRDAVGQRRFFFDHIVRIAHRAHPYQLLRCVKLFPQHRQHIHARVRLALQQRRDIASAHFQALRFFHGRSVGLMRRLLQHRSEPEKFAVRRFIHHDFLSVFVHGRDPHFSAHHHVRLPAGLTHLVDALSRSEILQLDLPCQHRRLVFIEQRKKRNVFQDIRIAGHRPPLLNELGWFFVFQALQSRATRINRAHSRPDDWRSFKMHSAKMGESRRGERRESAVIFHWIILVSTSCPAAYCFSNADILCAQRSSPSVPPNEMITASTWFVAAVTMVRSESLVALPCGPTVSANNGSPSKFKSYLPMPLYVSPARPARKTMSPTICPRSYNPIGRRLSTDTRLITSTTALICGKPFPATTRLSSASADPRYRAGSFPKALYALRAVSTCADSSTPRGKGNFSISFSRVSISWSSVAGDAPASTPAVTHASAVRGHFVFNFASIVTFIAPQFATGFSFAEKCRKNFACSIILYPRICSRLRHTSRITSTTYSMWLCVYARRGIASRTRSIVACSPNISVPISTERIPPSRYSSFANATPGNCAGGTCGRNARASIYIAWPPGGCTMGTPSLAM